MDPKEFKLKKLIKLYDPNHQNNELKQKFLSTNYKLN